MKGVNLNILFFLLAITSMTAQSESVNISAWIEVVDLPAVKKIELRGMIKNESDQELTLYQKMELTKSGTSGTAKHQQSGSFTVDPNRTKILGRSSFYKSNTDNYKVVFQIHNDLGIIFTDSLFYPEKPIIAQKEIPTKSVQQTPAKKESTKTADNPPTKTAVPNNKIIPPSDTNKLILGQKNKTTNPKLNNPIKKEKPKVAVNPAPKRTVPNSIKKIIPSTKNKQITSTRKSSTTVPVDVLEIDGLIIDETRSKIARDFYDLFYKKWIAPKGAKNFSIYIREEPSRGRGAQVSLTLNEQKIFQNFVPPRYDALENVVNFAIRITRARLRDQANINNQLKEEDQMGSGI